MSHNPIRNWDIISDGFTRREGYPDGCNWWWRELNSLSTDTHVVEYRTWRGHWDDLANQIVLHSMNNGTPPDVRLYGYSYGGYSMIKLARQLNWRGIPVRYMLLADAVYRHWYIVGQWRSIVPWSRLYIPPNVEEVFWFRQKNPRFALYRDNDFPGWGNIALPAGHEVVAEDPTFTQVHPPTILYCQHTHVDSQPSVKQKVVEVANAV